MAVKASKLGPGTLKLTPKDGTARDFSGQVTKMTFTPEYTSEDPVDVLSGDQYQEPGELAAKIGGDMLQDYGSDSLVQWCWDHMGEIADFEFVPLTSGKLQITGECMIQPVEIGGDVKKTNSTSFEFKVVGKPDLTSDYVSV